MSKAKTNNNSSYLPNFITNLIYNNNNNTVKDNSSSKENLSHVKIKDYFSSQPKKDYSIVDSLYKTRSQACLEVCVVFFTTLIEQQTNYSKFIAEAFPVAFNLNSTKNRMDAFIKRCDSVIMASFRNIPYSVPIGDNKYGWEMGKFKIMNNFKEELRDSYKEFFFLTEDYQKTIGIYSPINNNEKLKEISNKIISSIDKLLELNPYKTEDPSGYEVWKRKVFADLTFCSCEKDHTFVMSNFFYKFFGEHVEQKENLPVANNLITNRANINQVNSNNNSHVANLENRRNLLENKTNGKI